MRKAEEDKAKSMTTSMTEQQANRIREIANKFGLTISELFRQAVEFYNDCHGHGP